MAERDPISGSSRDYGAIAAPPTVGFSDFSPTELYNLSESIADNVNTINSGLRSLEKMMRQIGGPNDSVQLRDKIHDTQQNVNGCVSGTARDIQRLGVVARRGDKPQRLQVERLTQAFKDALDKYTAVQKAPDSTDRDRSLVRTARDIQRLGVGSGVFVARRGDEPQRLQAERLSQAFKDVLEKYTAVQKQLSEKMAAHMPRAARVRNDPSAMEQQAIADDEESTLLANQQAQARLVQFETSMLLEKEAYMNKIEADVLDVTQIIQDLNEMVQQQGQTVDTVQSHIEQTSANVEAGQDELAKAEQHQRSYRKKMLILSIIGIIIGIIVLVWIIKAFR